MCYHTVSRAAMDHHQKGQSYYLEVQNNPSPHMFVPLFPIKSTLPSLGFIHQPAQLKWENILTPHWKAPLRRPFKPWLPPTLLSTRRSTSVSITLTTSFLQANVQEEISGMEREWEMIWEVFPQLSKNHIRESETIHPPSPSTISSTISHTNISSTTHHTPSSFSYTTHSRPTSATQGSHHRLSVLKAQLNT